MNLLTISFNYLTYRLQNSILNIVMMAAGVMLITILLLFGYQLSQRLFADSKGIDAVIGAKGSPLQLVLSTVWHIDIPTGNIDFQEAERIKRHPQIKQAIPLSLGDSYKDFRIVGTQPSYIEHFQASFAFGGIWQNSMKNTPANQPFSKNFKAFEKPQRSVLKGTRAAEVFKQRRNSKKKADLQGYLEAVIGSQIAQKYNLKIGDNFIGSHGIVEGGEAHKNNSYKIVGILKPTKTVLDRLIITSLESVWDIHHHHEEGDEKHEVEEHEEKEITALLVTYKNRAAAMTFPRYINKNTNMQAASPSFEIARLIKMIGIGKDSIILFGSFLIALSLSSMLIGLLNSVYQRRYDLAIFRTLGATRKKIFLIVIIEGMIISFIGSLIGLISGHLIIEAIGKFSTKGAELGLTGFIFLPQIFILWLVILLFCLLTCLLPAIRAYKTDIKDMLTYV